jgi:hypothetical protein
MWDIVYYLALVVMLAVVMIAGAFLVRAYLSGTHPMDAVGALWAPRPEKRLFVVEQSNIDGRRRLILIRRDDVEHLIMTGGPVDMVIETGIGTPANPGRAYPAEPAVPERGVTPRGTLRS